MKKLFYTVSIAVMLTFSIISCEHVEIPQINNTDNQENGINVRLTISKIEQVSFDDDKMDTRAAEITDYCSRITLAFFQETEKVKMISQKASDDDFGVLQTTLPAGKYEFVVIAHNGNGNPEIKSLEEITFNGTVTMTDTFYYYGELDATESKEINVVLKRAVAMIRFGISDNVPEEVTRMKFYYTGGSSTFNAITGFGSKDSRQTEYRDVEASAYSRESHYDIYTFPHAERDTLKLTVTALITDDKTFKEQVFENIPVKINMITKYTGKFFENAQKPGEPKISVSFSKDEWDEEEYSY